jgi:hypothetical protein
LTPRRPYAEQLATVTPHCGWYDEVSEDPLSNPMGFFEICWTHHVLMG